MEFLCGFIPFDNDCLSLDIINQSENAFQEIIDSEKSTIKVLFLTEVLGATQKKYASW